MKMMRSLKKRLILLIVAIMILPTAVGVVSVATSQPVQAKDACEIAEEYGGNHTFWNLMCFIDRMFDYLFMGGDL